MRVLLTNDDGIDSTGLAALEAALTPLCELWVVAPDREQSAASHAISLSRPLRLTEVGPRRFTVDGTPTDSVYLAINHLMKDRRPQAVFSGINHGPNLAEDVLYSGTVAGAAEGAVLGVPFCAAVSAVPAQGRLEFAPAALLARALLEGAEAQIHRGHLLLNVNVPTDAIAGSYRVTCLGRRGYFAQVHENRDPRGRPYYWIGGPERAHEDLPGSDCNAVFDERRASVTPLTLDLTSGAGLGQLEGWDLPGFDSSASLGSEPPT
jgi:5'-nucleotidase